MMSLLFDDVVTVINIGVAIGGLGAITPTFLEEFLGAKPPHALFIKQP